MNSERNERLLELLRAQLGHLKAIEQAATRQEAKQYFDKFLKPLHELIELVVVSR